MKPGNHDSIDPTLEESIIALLLDELPPKAAAQLRARIDNDPALAAFHKKMESLLGLVREASVSRPELETSTAESTRLSEDRRQTLLSTFKTSRIVVPPKPRPYPIDWLIPVGIAATAIALAGLLLPTLSKSKASAQRTTASAEGYTRLEGDSEAAQPLHETQPPNSVGFSFRLDASDSDRDPEGYFAKLSAPLGTIALQEDRSAPGGIYSANAVGYVNQTLVAGAQILANPLNQGDNNLNTTLALSDGAVDATAFRFAERKQEGQEGRQFRAAGPMTAGAAWHYQEPLPQEADLQQFNLPDSTDAFTTFSAAPAPTRENAAAPTPSLWDSTPHNERANSVFDSGVVAGSAGGSRDYGISLPENTPTTEQGLGAGAGVQLNTLSDFVSNPSPANRPMTPPGQPQSSMMYAGALEPESLRTWENGANANATVEFTQEKFTQEMTRLSRLIESESLGIEENFSDIANNPAPASGNPTPEPITRYFDSLASVNGVWNHSSPDAESAQQSNGTFGDDFSLHYFGAQSIGSQLEPAMQPADGERQPEISLGQSVNIVAQTLQTRDEALSDLDDSSRLSGRRRARGGEEARQSSETYSKAGGRTVEFARGGEEARQSSESTTALASTDGLNRSPLDRLSPLNLGDELQLLNERTLKEKEIQLDAKSSSLTTTATTRSQSSVESDAVGYSFIREQSNRTTSPPTPPPVDTPMPEEPAATPARAQLATKKLPELAGKAVSDKPDVMPPAPTVGPTSGVEVKSTAPSIPIPQPRPEVLTETNPFSTFSLNVSDVSFKLAAASLSQNVMPDKSTVRSEEFLNAFDYHDPAPLPGAKLAFAWDQAQSPFEHNRDLLRFSIQTAAWGRQQNQPLNLVLLLDNSGSMEREDRVRIVQAALQVLAGQLTPSDRISVVAFARTPRLWVDALAGGNPDELLRRVGSLNPEGGTNLELALDQAYKTAQSHYLPNGNNRVILLTDGAANLGNVHPLALKEKVETERRKGIALDCFGIGWEGYNDDLIEVLSRNGDGRYGFINDPDAAATDFAGQLAGALRVAAADVKAQVEFNSERVLSYRQIGYEKHQLTKEQFRDNTVDAAEIGAAESGTALYAIQLKPGGLGPIGVVRVRYKVPSTDRYEEQEWLLPYNPAVPALDQAYPATRLAAVASTFAEWLASSPYAANVTLADLQQLLAGVPEVFPNDPRPRHLATLIQQARSLSGQ